MSHKVKPIGVTYEIKDTGEIVCEQHMSNTQPEWIEAAYWVIDNMVKDYSDCIDSVYVRGSTAQGTSQTGFSDLDIILLLKKGYRETKMMIEEQSHFDLFADGFNDLFPFVVKNTNFGIDISVLCWEDVTNVTNSSDDYAAFNIKYHSIFLWGNNRQSELRNYTIDTVPLIYTDGILLGYPISCKNIIRSLFEINLLNVKYYTRDIYWQTKELIRLIPGKKEKLKYLLKKAVAEEDPGDGEEELIEYIKEKAENIKKWKEN